MRHLLIGSGLAALLATVAAAPVLAQEYKAKLDGFFEIGDVESGGKMSEVVLDGMDLGAELLAWKGAAECLLDGSGGEVHPSLAGLRERLLSLETHLAEPSASRRPRATSASRRRTKER